MRPHTPIHAYAHRYNQPAFASAPPSIVAAQFIGANTSSSLLDTPIDAEPQHFFSPVGDVPSSVGGGNVNDLFRGNVNDLFRLPPGGSTSAVDSYVNGPLNDGHVYGGNVNVPFRFRLRGQLCNAVGSYSLFGGQLLDVVGSDSRRTTA
jgi:hypothetical protein